MFAIITFPEEKRSSFKNYKSPSIFNKILQQTNRSTSSQTLSGKLDLDDLRKARYPRTTKRATKRVSGLSCC